MMSRYLLCTVVLVGVFLRAQARTNLHHNLINKKVALEDELKNALERGVDGSGEGEPPLPTSDVTVSCGDRIQITVTQDQVFNDIHQLQLASSIGPGCSPVQDGDDFKFDFGLDDCGTHIESTGQYIVYSNSIRVVKDRERGDIQREHEQAILFRCRYDRKTKLEAVEFTGDVVTVEYEKEGFGKFGLSMGLYKDAFVTPVQTDDRIDVLDTLWAELKLQTSSQALGLAVQSCIATPDQTPPDASTYTFDIINGRCFKDDTAVFIGPAAQKSYRFSFQSFVFVELGDDVYIHCSVVVCESSDNSPTCQNPSGPCTRKRRWAEIASGVHKQYPITHGPFKQHRQRRDTQLTTETRSEAGSDLRTIATVAGGFLFVVLIAAVVIWRKRPRQPIRYTPLEVVSDVE